MEKDTKILMVEDIDTDALLIERELRKANINFVSERVESEEAFLKALIEFQPDIILSDYNLPQFTGLEALRLLRENHHNIPFILITGSLTEEVAVECMKEGAHDYILKTSLKRLPSAVLNALDKRGAQEEKIKAEAAMRRSEELYRLIAENTSDLICLLDTNGNYVYVSPSYREILGYAPEDLLGQSFLILHHPDERDDARRRFFQSLAGGKPGNREWRFKHSDGSWKVFDAVENWIYDSENKPQRAVIVSRDLTERKQSEKALRESEDQLRQAQKLEAVGQLAGGVAHDFNNILTVITGYSDILLKKTDEDHPNRAKLEEIKRAAERASSLTSQLLAFSRKQVLQPKLFNLNILVGDIGKMLRRLIGEDIELATVLTDEATEINADPGQLEQVLMNLVVNARDAMPNGGKLTIETSIVEIDRAYAEMHVAVQPGPYVVLAVSDNGSGMDEETRKHIFEPFYTTKEQGKGTGLGLSTVYGIVKQSGGNVWVYSELGRGTTFKVYLPRVAEAQETEESSAPIRSLRQGRETILLVEDEQSVRAYAKEILEDNGYLVMEARNGEEGLRICEEFEGRIDMMITDVVMPQMSGREIAERMAHLRPETKVLYISGYTDDAIMRHGILEDDMPFLQKPFTANSLLLKIRDALELVRAE